ncbi:hypothetical protein AB0N23_00850 [Streptomyces sp. NPDC052644]
MAQQPEPPRVQGAPRDGVLQGGAQDRGVLLGPAVLGAAGVGGREPLVPVEQGGAALQPGGAGGPLQDAYAVGARGQQPVGEQLVATR